MPTVSHATTPARAAGMLPAALVILVTVVAIGAAGSADPPASIREGAAPTAPQPPQVGQPFRTYPAVDLNGQPVDPAALLKGKVALVAFWASWCKPCIDEVPRLREIAQSYRRRGLVVVGVGLSEGGDTIPKQRAAAAREMMFYQLLFDRSGEFQRGYSISALPLNLLVGADGTVRWTDTALPEDLESRIQALLGETASEPGRVQGG